MSTNADEGSDEGTVPMKRRTKRILPRRGRGGKDLATGNGGESAAVRTPSRDTRVDRARRRAPSARDEVRVCGSPRCCITSPSHLLKQAIPRLCETPRRHRRSDVQAYGENLDDKLKNLPERIHKGSYRARPAKRSYIQKADGSKAL